MQSPNPLAVGESSENPVPRCDDHVEAVVWVPGRRVKRSGIRGGCTNAG